MGIVDHDTVVWVGDNNYRLTKAFIDSSPELIRDLVLQKRWAELTLHTTNGSVRLSPQLTLRLSPHQHPPPPQQVG